MGTWSEVASRVSSAAARVERRGASKEWRPKE
jgi:hypothetical protein